MHQFVETRRDADAPADFRLWHRQAVFLSRAGGDQLPRGAAAPNGVDRLAQTVNRAAPDRPKTFYLIVT